LTPGRPRTPVEWKKISSACSHKTGSVRSQRTVRAGLEAVLLVGPGRPMGKFLFRRKPFKQYLAISVPSASAESISSHASDIITQKREGLNKNTFKMMKYFANRRMIEGIDIYFFWIKKLPNM
jgi:hypothetical protein